MRPADHSSRGVLPIVVCLTDCAREASTMRKPGPTRSIELLEKKIIYLIFTHSNIYASFNVAVTIASTAQCQMFGIFSNKLETIRKKVVMR